MKSYTLKLKTTFQYLIATAMWLNCNKLTPDIKKTFFLVFQRPNTVPPPNSLTLSFKNNCITHKSMANFLGAIFIEFLS